MSVQPGLRYSNDLRVGRKLATFQLFFQSGRAKDLSAPIYPYGIRQASVAGPLTFVPVQHGLPYSTEGNVYLFLLLSSLVPEQSENFVVLSYTKGATHFFFLQFKKIGKLALGASFTNVA